MHLNENGISSSPDPFSGRCEKCLEMRLQRGRVFRVFPCCTLEGKATEATNTSKSTNVKLTPAALAHNYAEKVDECPLSSSSVGIQLGWQILLYGGVCYSGVALLK